MTSTLSVMSLEAKKLRIGKYTMWFNDNAIYCSDSEKTWVLHLSEGTEITPYDPTTSMNILPYIKTDIMDYKNQTVFNALYEGLSYVLQNIKDINELKNGMADIAYIREDLNNNFNFGDNLEIKKDILIDNKTITGIAGTIPTLAENVQLMTLQYYEAHKSELKGEKGDKGDKGDDGLDGEDGEDGSGLKSFLWDLFGFGIDAAEIYGAVQAIGILEGQIAGLQGQIMALGLDNITDDMMDGLNDALDELNEVGDDMEDDSQSNAITRLTAAIKKIQATLRDHEQRLSKAENNIQQHDDKLKDHSDRLDQYKDRLDQLNTVLQQFGDFLWMHLGEKDPYYIMPILAAIFTFLTSKLSMMGQPEGTNNMMNNMMLYFMPIMTGFIAFNLPSALSIYWVVTNAFSVGQTLLLQNPFKIRREREEKEAAEKARKKRLEKAKRKAYKSKRK